MSQSKLIPLRRRPRPRLRVKTGCLTCLNRHKKCDETKPSCQACTRLRVECIWRDSAPDSLQLDQHTSLAQPTQLRRRSPNPPHWTPPPSRNIAGHSGFRSTSDQSMFAYFVSIFGPTLCDGRSHPFYRDNSHCLSLALQVPWLMDAILALAVHHFAQSQKESSTSALEHYGQAIRGIRNSVANMTLPEDPVLCAVTFAGLFEERLSDRQDSLMVHFYSSCNFLQALTPNLAANRGSKARMAFLRQQADLAVYHIATRAIFEPDTQRLSTKHYMEGLDTYVQRVHPGPQDVDPFPSSSFLGPVPGLYSLVYQITLLARKTPLGIFDLAQAQAYHDRIIEIKALFDAASFLHFGGEDVANPFLAEDCTPRLYILALDVMLTKIMHPGTTAANPDIQNRIHEAYRLLSRRSFVSAHDAETHGDMSYHLAEPLCWPLLVIGVAALRKEHRNGFEKVLDDLWNVSYNGFVRRVSAILKRVWSIGEDSMSKSRVTDPMVVDRQDSVVGLDILLQKKGLS